MQTNITRLVCVTLIVTLCLSFGLRLRAQAPAAAPVIVFSLPNNTKVSRSVGMVQVGVTGTYAPGLRSISLSGGYSGGVSYFQNAPQSASTSVGFYVGYFAPGAYKFRATVVGVDNHYTQQFITVNVVP